MTVQGHFLDRPAARIVAGAVFVAAIGILGFLHRHELFPPSPGTLADDPYDRCVAARQAELDKMRAENVIGEEQAALFKIRLEALCRAQTEDRQRGGERRPPGLQPAPTR